MSCQIKERRKNVGLKAIFASLSNSLQVDPVTGHSTLNANQIGLPRSSVDLIDAAVEDTNISAPQPVGAFSSSVAVKPTSGNSTDLNKIIGNSFPLILVTACNFVLDAYCCSK